MNRPFRYEELERMTPSELDELLNSITDDQAINSDVGGDSDAEDDKNHPSTSKIRRVNTDVAGNLDLENEHNKESDNELEENFEENVPDPIYIPQTFVDSDTGSDTAEEVRDDFTFSKVPSIPQTFQNFQFNENFGPKVEVDTSSPLAIFLIIFADALHLIVEPSNLYATQNGVDLNLNLAELKAFLGILIVMGYHTVERREGTLGEEVIITISDAFHNLGYCFFFDRFFSTIPLLRKLLSLKTFGCGTIMGNRKHFPKTLLRADRHLKTGEMDFATTGEISICKWKDRGSKCVLVASNMHNPVDGTFVLRRNKEGEREQVHCPKAIEDYNKYMGGVDKFDQNMESYSISQKSRRWWLKIFYFLLDASIVNSYILYKTTLKLSSKKQKPMTHLMFRKTLANELISDFCSRPKKGRRPEVLVTKNKMYKKQNGTRIAITQLVNVGIHLPVKGTCRRCAYCSTKEVPKKSQIMCKACKVNFCLECYAVFHEQNNNSAY
ncbi:piggybac transposable element-derived protein 4 [Holotrichia oblita]|uniref:Piggybac transposable element-derived protein 4 n=1 Tax=Holotrichia oblita TaxID=644536 RepID=A0ACB9SI60_HOLOL|nr:piggybac transposable element-derived protein 4 [Holotrichia oblita]